MMSGAMGDFNDDIDWGVYKNQQNPTPPSGKGGAQAMEDQGDQFHRDQPLGKQPPDQGEMVDTFLGKMPRHMPQFQPGTPENKKMLDEMIGAAAGGPGMKLLGEGAAMAKPIIAKGINYFRPSQAGKAAEEFRGTLGEGTSTENINELGKRVQMGKESAKQEALIPKNELYSQEGKTNIFDVNKANLPEGNLPKIAHMVEPGAEFGESQSAALAKALKDYRKTGSVDSFLEKSEDIFNIPELSEKAASKIEDALLMPTKRNSAYFGEEGVTDMYGSRGKLLQLHNAFEDTPNLANYDALQSALGKRIRTLESRVKAKTIDDAGEAKLEALSANRQNLLSDKENFMQTLPDKMQNLETEFRTKYAKNVAPYEEAGTTIKKLLDPKRINEVTPEQVTKTFGRPNVNTQKILQDIGPSGARNVLYNALMKVPEGDAEGMAKTILDLKQTKGFDKIVSSDMEAWANKMLKRSKYANFASKHAKTLTGALGGGLMGGVPGAIAGGMLMNAPKGMEMLSKYLKR
jgi:hypothetical protein